jgi:hypothetical protein
VGSGDCSFYKAYLESTAISQLSIGQVIAIATAVYLLPPSMACYISVSAFTILAERCRKKHERSGNKRCPRGIIYAPRAF